MFKQKMEKKASSNGCSLLKNSIHAVLEGHEFTRAAESLKIDLRFMPEAVLLVYSTFPQPAKGPR